MSQQEHGEGEDGLMEGCVSEESHVREMNHRQTQRGEEA